MLQLSNLKKQTWRFAKAYCIVVFTLVFATLLSVTVTLENYSHTLFQCLLLFAGWFAWTFFEYMTHRYLMHYKNTEKPLLDFNHKHHHTHPTDIRVTALHRSMLLTGCILLIALSVWLNNYFTLAAGFLCGFPGYTLIHYLLHQKKMQPIFGKMIQYHIIHHCKKPDKCFGISVTWWDDILGTTPEKGYLVSQRIVDFYFKKDTHTHNQ